MRYFYTVFTQVVDGVQETLETTDFKVACEARSAGKHVRVSVNGFGNTGRRF